MSETGRERSEVDARTATFAAGWLIALSQLLINVQPLSLGAIAEAHHLSDRQLGYLSAAFVGSSTWAPSRAGLGPSN